MFRIFKIFKIFKKNQKIQNNILILDKETIEYFKNKMNNLK